MKKFLLSCALALGIGANAQIYTSNGFESGVETGPNTGDEVDWTYTSASVTPQYWSGVNSVFTCSTGTYAFGGIITANSGYIRAVYAPTVTTGNGLAISVSASAARYNAGAGNNTANLAFEYSVNGGTTWTAIGTNTNVNSSCVNKTGTIAADVVTAANSSQFRLRATLTRTAGNNNNATQALGGCFFWLDNIKVEQTVPAPPSCTTVTTPTTGVNPNDNPAITWAAAPGSAGYKVYLGNTTPGNYNVVNGTTVTTLTYTPALLAANTTYYAKIVPTNTYGDASGCSELTFTTGAATYCSVNVVASDHTSWEKIANVKVANIDNPSTSTAAYEDFTSVIGKVEREGNYPATVTISSFDSDQTRIWIDFNQNGIFGDVANEVFTLTTAATSNGNVIIPADAPLGSTRMRVRTNYQAAPPACGNTNYGQVEDYTIEVYEKGTLSVSDISKATISVYPNPFTDVLNISNVKGVKSVSVNDVSGREVKSLAPSAELNLSNLKAGLYIVNLKMEDGSVKTFKAIKK